MRYALTLPIGTGATLTVHADTAEELLVAATSVDVRDLATLVPAPLPRTSSTPSSTPPGLVGPAPSCAHGARVHRTGTSEKGPWSAWFCGLPKERKHEQCEPLWIDTKATVPVPAFANAAPF